MTDYHPLIARAVEGLDRSTGEARWALYERARHALVAQLRSNQPALLEADITKERLALEEAIRKVEAEAARKSRSEPRAETATSRRMDGGAAQCARTVIARVVLAEETGNQGLSQRRRRSARSWRGDSQDAANRAPNPRSL